MLILLNYIRQYKFLIYISSFIFALLFCYSFGYKKGNEITTKLYEDKINMLTIKHNKQQELISKKNLELLNEVKNKEKEIIVKYINKEKVVNEIINKSNNMNCELTDKQLKQLNNLTRNN